MKRGIVFLLASVLLLIFSGCGEAKKEDRGFDSARSFMHSMALVQTAETPDTVYFIEDNNSYLKYVDKASGISGVLCGKPECRHQTKDCNAYLGLTILSLFVDGGRLYWVASQPGVFGWFMYSAALDGTDRREEMELSQEFISKNSTGMGFRFHDQWLYFYSVSSELVDGEETHYNYVTAFPLDSSKKPIEILKEEIPFFYYGGTLLIQFYDGYLYILSTAETEPYDPGEETALYDLKLRRWDPESGEIESLYEEGGSELSNTLDLWVTDDAVFFNRNTPAPDIETRIYRYDPSTESCEHIFDNGVYGWINMAMIADNLVSGCRMLPQEDGSYKLRIVLKDFEGNVLVDDTYGLELAEEFAQSWSPFLSFLGRDENYVYYSYSGRYESGNTNLTYVSIITVALDGSGARVLCTQTEDGAFRNGGVQP